MQYFKHKAPAIVGVSLLFTVSIVVTMFFVGQTPEGRPPQNLDFPPNYFAEEVLAVVRKRQPPPDSMSHDDLAQYLMFGKDWLLGSRDVTSEEVEWLLGDIADHESKLIRGRVLHAYRMLLLSKNPLDGETNERIWHSMATGLADPDPYVREGAAIYLMEVGGLDRPDIEPLIIDFLRNEPDGKSRHRVGHWAKNEFPERMAWWEFELKPEDKR